MSAMMLAASQKTENEITADGDEAQEAINALLTLIQNKFGEQA